MQLSRSSLKTGRAPGTRFVRGRRRDERRRGRPAHRHVPDPGTRSGDRPRCRRPPAFREHARPPGGDREGTASHRRLPGLRVYGDSFEQQGFSHVDSNRRIIAKRTHQRSVRAVNVLLLVLGRSVDSLRPPIGPRFHHGRGTNTQRRVRARRLAQDPPPRSLSGGHVVCYISVVP